MEVISARLCAYVFSFPLLPPPSPLPPHALTRLPPVPLPRPGQPGFREALVDSEGFPRADIDVHQVRIDRHRHSVLRADHQALENEMKDLLDTLHAQSRRNLAHPESTPTTVSTTNNGDISTMTTTRVPFAVIDEMRAGSPAAMAGLMVGDHVVSLGSVRVGASGGGPSRSHMELLQAAAREVQAGQPMLVEVERLGEGLRRLSVTPGGGVLGCHFAVLPPP